MRTTARIMLAVAAGIAFRLAHAEVVDFAHAGNDGVELRTQATLTLPETPSALKRPAIVILHHAGGWRAGTTGQYASFLAAQGFVALEPRMFDTDGEREDTYRHLPAVFGSLAYLAARPDVDSRKIALMGLSYGGLLSLYAGTDWATKRYSPGEPRYAAIAAFYPLCWVGHGYATRTIGKWKNKAYPESLMDRWAGIPLAIFAGGLDDYDARDANACAEFVAAIPDPAQKAVTQVHVHAQGTHGWDQGKTYSFFARTACKGAGCQNTNVSDPELTQKVKAELLEFLRTRLGLKSGAGPTSRP